MKDKNRLFPKLGLPRGGRMMHVIVHVTEQERELLKALADRDGKSLSQFCRDAIEKSELSTLTHDQYTAFTLTENSSQYKFNYLTKKNELIK